MFLTEFASEPQLLVIYPGRFMPFHKGHAAVYNYLVGKFGRNNVFIVTSDKVEPPRSPFTFSEKSYFMQLSGIAADRIVQCSQPYQIDKIIATGHVTVPDPTNTVVIFAVSEKDMAEDPRFKSWTKKDGTPAYFQPMPDKISETESMQQHGYIMTVPTFDFAVMGQPMRSGTELRELYVNADEQQRQAIIKDLFGKYTREAEHLMTNKLAPHAPVEAPRPNTLPKTAKAAGGVVAESEGRPTHVKVGNLDSVGNLSSKNTAEPGDLLVTHKGEIGIYIGNGKLKSTQEQHHNLLLCHPLDQVFAKRITPQVTEAGLNGEDDPLGTEMKAPKPKQAPKTKQAPMGGSIGRGLRSPLKEEQLDSLIADIQSQIKPGMPSKYIDELKQRIEKLQARRNGEE